MAENESSRQESDSFQLLFDTKRVREILVSLVNCHEDSLDPAVGGLGSFSFLEVRQALASAAHQIVGQMPLSTSRFRLGVKQLSSSCTLTLTIKYSPALTTAATAPPHRVDLHLLDTAISKAYLIQLSLTVQGGQDVFDSSFVGFKDRRQSKDLARVGLGGGREYRHLWRGLRWLCANLLTWERAGIILPEDLDDFRTHFLPPPRSS